MSIITSARSLFDTQKGGTPGHAIVMYHGIDLAGSKTFNYRFIGQKEFERQLVFFKENFHVVSMSEYFAGEFHKEKTTLALSFDDGYANNFTHALPVLEKLQTPASIFITTARAKGIDMLTPDLVDIFSGLCSEDFRFADLHFQKNRQGYYFETTSLKLLRDNEKEWTLETKLKLTETLLSLVDFKKIKAYNDYWQLLDEEQIKKLAASEFVSLGSHGLYHNAFTNISLDEAKEELRLSRQYLEGIIQEKVNCIAYPYGLYSRKLLDLSEQAGYQQQLAVNYKFDEDVNDPRINNRIGLYTSQSFKEQMREVQTESYNNIQGGKA